jgi:lysophospholipase L1-like esterase
MRLLLAGLISLPLLAQPPAPPPANPAVPPLRAINELINDYANLRRYAADNKTIAAPAAGEDRVVFMGDSITDAWGRGQYATSAPFFPGKPYINRGISGQTTAQMLLRFYPDVIAHKPKIVVFLAGTNDIAGNLGPVSMESIENNLAAMADIARANGIKVVLGSVMPVCDYHRPQTAARPPEKIKELNAFLKSLADKNRYVYLDYYTPMLDDKGMLKAEITGDGLHPNAAGYKIMAPLAEEAIAKALGK